MDGKRFAFLVIGFPVIGITLTILTLQYFGDYAALALAPIGAGVFITLISEWS